MSNISIYLTEEQQQKLDILTKRGLVQDLSTNKNTSVERSRSALIGMLIDQEISKLEEAEMIADAVEIDNLNLGWNDEEEICQAIDMEVFGQ